MGARKGQATCSVYRIAGTKRPKGPQAYRGVRVPMIVQTRDRGIVTSERAPEPVARLWAKCQSINTGETYRVVKIGDNGNPYDPVAVYRNGREIPTDG